MKDCHLDSPNESVRLSEQFLRKLQQAISLLLRLLSQESMNKYFTAFSYRPYSFLVLKLDQSGQQQRA